MTSHENSITFVVAALNEENQLEGAVKTIVDAAEKWFDEYEILIYNDGSTDRTAEVAEELANRYQHIQVFHHQRPRCIGGVMRSGFKRARMRYVIWVDGKGATTAEVLDRIFAQKGQADLVIPFPTNQHERHLMRRIISRCFIGLLNTLFRLKLTYYTHCALFETEQARRFKIHTDSYAYQAEALIKLIKSGCSYVEVGVEDNYYFEGRSTKAFKPKNVFGIARFLTLTFWDVYIRRVCSGSKKDEKQGPRMPWWKRVIYSLIPITLLLLTTEGLLRCFDYESPVADPYESFVLHKPLFEPQGEFLVVARARQKFFHAQSFGVTKPANAKRVFVFGGSTTYGWTLPDPRRDSYVNLLGRQLEDEFPDTRFEMINCGGLSYASYRLVDLVEECMEYSPDLIIVMSGHNEFIEARHYANLIGATSKVDRLWYSLRTVRLMQHLSDKINAQRYYLGDDPFVTERYIVRDEKEFQYTLDHYSNNLKRMIDACKSHDTPIILCTCPSNILDQDPFYTKPPSGVPDDEFKSLAVQAMKLVDAGEFEKSMAIARDILREDPRSSFFHFIMGKCYYGMGRMDEAKESLILAKDTDAFPKRALTSFNESVRKTARQADVTLFDAEARFFAEAEHGIPGEGLFADDCHPTVEGHQLFADGLRELSAKHLSGMDQ